MGKTIYDTLPIKYSNPTIELPFYYINLDKSKHRKACVEASLNKYNINGVRISGIQGSEYSNNGTIIVDNVAYPYCIDAKKILPSDGQRGCALSHLKAVISIKNSNSPYAVIIEDDLDFQLMENWIQKFSLQDIIDSAPADWELIKLHNSNVKTIKHLYNQYKSGQKYQNIVAFDPANWSTMCYIINTKYIDTFYKQYYRNSTFVFNQDYFVADIIQYCSPRMYDYTLPLFTSKCLSSIICGDKNNEYDDASNQCILKIIDVTFRINNEPCTQNTKRCVYPYSDINTPSYICCKNHIVDLIKFLVDLMNKYNMTYFLDYGSLLGCARNNSFIPWDTDGDISIIDKGDIIKFFEKINKNIVNNNYYLEKQSELKYVLYYSKINSLHIDISIRKKNNNLWCDQYPNWAISDNDLFPLIKSLFENIEVNIPNNFITYLNKGYGDNCIDKPRRQLCNECYKKGINHIKYTKCPK